MSDQSSRSSAMQDGADAENTDKFVPRRSHLNTLPSRQNMIFDFGGDTPPSPSTEIEFQGCQACSALKPKQNLSFRKDFARQGAELGSSRLELQRSRSKGSESSNISSKPLLQDQAVIASDTGLKDSDALSAGEAVFNLVNTVVGVGVLSVPFAFRLSGYSALLLLLLVICVTSHTGKLIGKSLKLAARSPDAFGIPRKGRDFAFLAYVAFGNSGRVMIGAVTSMEIWFALVTFMVMNGLNAEVLWPDFGCVQAVVISNVLATITVFVPMRFFSYLSLISSLSLAVAALALIGSAMAMPSWANPYNHLGEPALYQPQNVPRSVGLLVFCFAGHPCFPIVHECMRNPEGWGTSVNATFLLALFYYGSVGVFGYLVFGQLLEASFTENIATVQGATLWRNVSAFAFLIKIQLTAPLLLNATLVAIWPPAPNKPEWSLRRMVALWSLALLTTVVAVSCSHAVAALASLTGSLFTMTTSVLFPIVAYIYLSQKFENAAQLSRRELIKNGLVLAFGVVMAFSGTCLAVQDLLKRTES